MRGREGLYLRSKGGEQKPPKLILNTNTLPIIHMYLLETGEQCGEIANKSASVKPHVFFVTRSFKYPGRCEDLKD